MKSALVLVTAVFALTFLPSHAQMQPTIPTDNAKLTELYKVDQGARMAKDIDWSKLTAEDAARRKQVRDMLDAGDVKTGLDYFHAALVFQHGDHAEDYLLAHVLAVTAISLGSPDARWLAAATLDRYLRSTNKEQIYGTQFQTVTGQPMIQQPLATSLVSDSMRAAACVVPTAEQTKILNDVNAGKPFRSTHLSPCK